jgi:hypothetical protein
MEPLHDSPAFMEGTFMVASSGQGEFGGLVRHAIKLLDLLTNRYHVGVVESAWEEGLRVELPPMTRLCAGQRVRFVVASEDGLVSKGSMRRALVSDVHRAMPDRMSIELALMPEAGLS